MKTMAAVRKVEPGPGLTVEQVPVPTPGPHDVLVRIEAAGICGTDVHIHNWDPWSQQRIHPPITVGHEFAGTVVEVGEDVEHVAVGDYVSAESHITCGMCYQCRTGQAHLCPRTKILGVDTEGVFAEYAALPEKIIWKNDRAKLPPEVAAVQEPFGNAVYATLSHDLAGATVAVLGCGPIGLFSIGIARSSGAMHVWASDVIEYRLDLARKMGADAVVNAAKCPDVVGWFHEQNEGYPLDLVLEMSGSAAGITQSFQIVRRGGRVTLFGIPADTVRIDVAESMIFKNLTVLALNGRRIFDTWYRTRWLLEGGVVDIRPLITHEMPMERIGEAIELIRSGAACKIVLHPGGEPFEPPEAKEAKFVNGLRPVPHH
jgi:threonine 3-dehydrogenase